MVVGPRIDARVGEQASHMISGKIRWMTEDSLSSLERAACYFPLVDDTITLDAEFRMSLPIALVICVLDRVDWHI